VELALEDVGPLSERAAVGDGARGLQPGRRCVAVLPPRSRAVARVPLGRGRARRLLRFEAATVFRRGALEREGPDPEGAALRLEQCRGEPRRGREGVLLLSRFHADPLVHEVAVQVPPGRLPVRRPREDECAPHAQGLRVRARRQRRLPRRPLLRRLCRVREGGARGSAGAYAAWDLAFHAVYEHLLWIAGAMDHGGHHIDL